MIKLSELNPGTLVEYRGEIKSAEEIKALVISGNIEGNVFIVTDDCISNILEKSYNLYKNGIASDIISAPNNGEKILLDL